MLLLLIIIIKIWDLQILSENGQSIKLSSSYQNKGLHVFYNQEMFGSLKRL
jgi:hypothetical protein